MNVRIVTAANRDDLRLRFGSALTDDRAGRICGAASEILCVDGALPAEIASALVDAGAIVAATPTVTLIAVSRNVLDRWAPADDAARALYATLEDALTRAMTPSPSLRLRERRFDVRDLALVMGIVNVSPESFYEHVDGTGAVVTAAARMARSGAALVDLGGQSYADGNPRIAAERECARVVPAIRAIVEAGIDVAVSVDTVRADVADAALRAGAHLVNDCSGLSDPALADTVAAHDAGLVVMHLKGELNRREPSSYRYADALAEIVDMLYERTQRALAAGIARDAILVDPGLEFGKEPETDLEILDRFGELRALGFPIVLASSRKRFLGRVFDRPAQDLLVPSLATAAIGIAAGARVLRVHDVAETVALARTIAAVTPRGRYTVGQRLRAERPAVSVPGNSTGGGTV